MLRPTPTTFSDSIKRPRDYSSARARSVTEPLAVVLALLLCHACAWAGLQVKPGYVEVTLDKGRPAGSFLITNIGTTPERLRINAFHFNYTEQGGITQSPTGEHSLAQWLHFNPRELSLAPKTSRAVRFTIAPRGKLKPGEYWGAMELESLAVQRVTGEAGADKSVSLGLMYSIMVPIFGTVGQVRYEGQLSEPNLVGTGEGVFVRTLLTNSGTGRLRPQGTCQITNPAGKVVAEARTGRSYVLRDGRRWFQAPVDPNVPLPEGTYTLRASFDILPVKDARNKPLVRETQFEWKPPPTSEKATQSTNRQRRAALREAALGRGQPADSAKPDK